MKKMISLILLLCMVLSFAVYANAESTAPEITLQEIYDAGKDYAALLGDHESVYVQAVSDGKVVTENYLSRQYSYTFYDEEYMDLGFDYESFVTDHSAYTYFIDTYSLNVTLALSGMVDMKEIFAEGGMGSFISPAMLNDTFVATEKDGMIIVTCVSGMEDIAVIGEGVVSCEETYTIDAKTRELTAVKTVYTYEDGTVEEGIITITRDVEAPEGVKSFLAYDQETENMRTITIVSNPGAENEKTDIIKVAKGLPVSFTPAWDENFEGFFTMYADAACTQPIVENLDFNSDNTAYIKWDL